MALFHSGDGVYLSYSDLAAAKRFWIETFGCSETKLPEWDDPLPSDIALKLPGEDEPGIGLFDHAEVAQAGLHRPNTRAIIFSNNIGKAHAYLTVRGLQPGPVEKLGGMQFFGIQDCEGNTIEICMEE
jgi:hypothetical protein